jgi:signal transduction histidine kinase
MVTTSTPDRLATSPIGSVWRLLTQPHPTIIDPSERRKAHITAALLLASAVSLAFQLIIAPTISALIPVLLAFASYGVSRTRYVNAAVLMCAAAFALSVFWQMAQVADWSRANVLGFLGWLVVPVVLSGLLLSPRETFMMVVAIVFTMFGLRAAFFTTIPNASFGVAAGFVMTLSAIITLASYLQEFYFVRPRLEEIRQAQRELEVKNRALELANAEIKDFSYMIAHDLRTPVINVTEYVQEIRYSLHTVKPALDAGLNTLEVDERPAVQLAMYSELPESLAFVESSAKRMSGLINEILRLARIGQRDSAKEILNPRILIQSILRGYAGRLDEKSVSIEMLPVAIFADRLVLEEVFNNLIDNAIKYAAPERPLQIAIRAEDDTEKIIFHVEDNGRGIPSAEETNVFKPFRRASNTIHVDGTGVGLYYVRALLERQGGRIWFSSQAGTGTTFSFSIVKETEGDMLQ